MYKISPEVVIANYFAEARGSMELNLSTLAKIKQGVEIESSKKRISLHVDNTRDSVLEAVNSNPKYFYFGENNDVIKFKNQFMEGFLEDFYFIFNSKFENKKIKIQFLAILSKVFLDLGLTKV